jgi:hypothetical protein
MLGGIALGTLVWLKTAEFRLLVADDGQGVRDHTAELGRVAHDAPSWICACEDWVGGFGLGDRAQQQTATFGLARVGVRRPADLISST